MSNEKPKIIVPKPDDVKSSQQLAKEQEANQKARDNMGRPSQSDKPINDEYNVHTGDTNLSGQ